jgi:hypothetical protein
LFVIWALDLVIFSDGALPNFGFSKKQNLNASGGAKMKVKSLLNNLWLLVTIVAGAAILILAIFPEALQYLGVDLSHEALVVGVRVFLVTSLWFILGSDRATLKVAEVEKSAPIALIALGLTFGIILEGKKLIAILAAAGFGLVDVLIFALGAAAVAAGFFWAAKTYGRSSQ